MDEGTIIPVVQNSSKQQRSEDMWRESGKILKKSNTESRKRWARLRDNYRKGLLQRKPKPDHVATLIKPPKFDKELTYIFRYLYNKDTGHSSVSNPTTVSNDNESKANIVHDRVKLSKNKPGAFFAPSTTRATIPMGKIRRTGTKKVPEEPSVASVLQDFLKNKKRVDIYRASSQQKTADDLLTAFFVNMAKTVKTFPIRDQLEIKRKLFQLVNSVEMKIAAARANSNT